MASKKEWFGWEMESVRQFDKKIQDMDKAVRADTKVVVKNAARDMVFELIAATPIGTGRTRGFAKAGWGNAMVALNVQPRAWYFRGGGPRGETWREFGGHQDKLGDRHKPTFALINYVPYIREMRGSSAVVPLASRQMAVKYEKRLKGMGNRMAKRWKK